MTLSAEQVLAQQAAEYKNAPRYSRWQPPDGLYVEVLQEVEVGFIKRDNKDVAAVTLWGQIVDGEYQGKRNSLGTFYHKNFGMLADVVDMMGGTEQPSADAAAAFLRAQIGAPIQVEVKTTAGKSRDGQPARNFTNANILGLVPIPADAGPSPEISDTNSSVEPENEPPF